MTNPDLTTLVIVADCSYSMIAMDTEMNTAVQALLLDQAGQPGHCEVSILQFSDGSSWLTKHAEVSKVVTAEVIRPSGNTALNDALGKAIKEIGADLAARPEEDRPGHVLVLVVTDGIENASREFTTEVIKGLVTEQRQKWAWDFTFLGANIDAWVVAQNLGFARDATMTFAPTAGGVANSIRSVNAYATATRGGVVAAYDDNDRSAAMED